MKRALVTGATGFVGANLVRRLLADGHEVHVLTRPESKSWRLHDINKQIKIHQGPLEDIEVLSDCLQKVKPQWVFHLAAYGAYSWQNAIKQIIATNVSGIVNLLSCLANTDCESFIAAGSSSEYGYKNHAPAEDEWLEPNSEYAVSKAAATHLCRLFAQKYGLKTAVLRLYSVYGPYEDKDRLIPTIIKYGEQKKLPPLVDPEIARDFVYVDDAVSAFIATAASKTIQPGAVYNVGTGKQTSLRDVVSVASKIFAIQEKPQWGSMPNRKWDTAVWVANTTKIEKELNWQSQYTFEQGLLQTIEWYRNQVLTIADLQLQYS